MILVYGNCVEGTMDEGRMVAWNFIVMEDEMRSLGQIAAFADTHPPVIRIDTISPSQKLEIPSPVDSETLLRNFKSKEEAAVFIATALNLPEPVLTLTRA
jgi:hypothetical protein